MTANHPAITTKFGQISTSEFTPLRRFQNAHIQTIWPKFFAELPTLKTTNIRLDTPDSDFLDVAEYIPNKPEAVLIAFHGLEGSIDSHYIKLLFNYLYNRNIGCYLMHFRGCSGEINRQPRAYHSGETSDAKFVIEHLLNKVDNSPVFLAGFSLGGNMLLNLLAQEKDAAFMAQIKGAMSVSAPIDLASSSESINYGFSRLYQWHLMKSMKANVLKKMSMMDLSDFVKLSKKHINRLSTFRQFDEHITAPLHGFDGADDYYAKASALPLLKGIQTPTLVLHAKDDPFMDERVIPNSSQLSPNVAYELSEYGGHVGFCQHSGSQRDVTNWLSKRLYSFIQELL